MHSKPAKAVARAAARHFAAESTRLAKMAPSESASLSAAVACICAAYNINRQDVENSSGTEVQELKQACELPPESPGAEEERMQRAENLKAQGNEFMRVADFEAAKVAYTKAIKESPNPFYYSNRAAALTRLMRYYEAVSDCEVAIALKPDYDKAWNRLGVAKRALGNYHGAEEAFAKALEINPSNKNHKENLDAVRAAAAADKPVEQAAAAKPSEQAAAASPSQETAAVKRKQDARAKAAAAAAGPEVLEATRDNVPPEGLFPEHVMKLSQLAREIPEVADWQRRLAELLATTHAHPDGQTRREILAVHIPRLWRELKSMENPRVKALLDTVPMDPQTGAPTGIENEDLTEAVLGGRYGN